MSSSGTIATQDDHFTPGQDGSVIPPRHWCIRLAGVNPTLEGGIVSTTAVIKKFEKPLFDHPPQTIISLPVQTLCG